MLKAFWGDRFSVQCTGGDASFPGAQRQDLHADVPVKEVADQPHDWRREVFIILVEVSSDAI